MTKNTSKSKAKSNKIPEAKVEPNNIPEAKVQNIQNWKYHCVYKGAYPLGDIIIHSNNEDDANGIRLGVYSRSELDGILVNVERIKKDLNPNTIHHQWVVILVDLDTHIRFNLKKFYKTILATEKHKPRVRLLIERCLIKYYPHIEERRFGPISSTSSLSRWLHDIAGYTIEYISKDHSKQYYDHLPKTDFYHNGKKIEEEQPKLESESAPESVSELESELDLEMIGLSNDPFGFDEDDSHLYSDDTNPAAKQFKEKFRELLEKYPFIAESPENWQRVVNFIDTFSSNEE